MIAMRRDDIENNRPPTAGRNIGPSAMSDYRLLVFRHWSSRRNSTAVFSFGSLVECREFLRRTGDNRFMIKSRPLIIATSVLMIAMPHVFGQSSLTLVGDR